MGDFPAGTLTKSDLDEGTDNPAAARIELAAAIDKINAILASYASANGIADLDATGKIPAARIPAGADSGVDADLLDGQHGAFYRSASNLSAGTLPATRFADLSHGNRGGGSQHAVATESVAGFMSAADKAAVDGIDSSIAAVACHSLGGSAVYYSRDGNTFNFRGIAVNNTTSDSLAEGLWEISLSASSTILTITLVQGTYTTN